jgi:hypothetical protein
MAAAMPWLFIVLGMVASLMWASMSGDERVVCRAARAEPGESRPAADCTIQIHRWLGRQLYRDDTARGVETFELRVERSPASDPNDPPNVRSSLALRTRDGQVFQVDAHQDEIEAEVQRARQWQSQGMPGEYVFVARTQGGLAPVVAVGSLLGGVVGLSVQRARGRRPPRP